MLAFELSMVKMCTKLVFVLVFLSSILADTDISSCNTNKCYQTVNTSYENLLRLINRLNSTASKAEIPKNYDTQNLKNHLADIESIKKEIRNTKTRLENGARKLNRTDKNTANTQKTVTQLLEKISNISEYDTKVKNLLTEARIHNKQLLALGENASTTCREVSDKYTEFKKIIDDVIRDYDDVSNKYDNGSREAAKLNSDVKKTFKETVTTKNKLDELPLPVNLVDYNRLSMEMNFNKSINRLKDNVKRLKQKLKVSQKKWNDDLEKRAREVAKNISQLLDDLNRINGDLKEYERAFEKTDSFQPTVNDESRNLLKSLRNQLERLERDFKLINFTDDEKLLLLNNRDDEKNIAELGRKRLLIKDYNLILDALIDGINIKKVRKEINTLKITISLIEEWKKLDTELGRLRANRDAILNINCTNPNGSTILT